MRPLHTIWYHERPSLLFGWKSVLDSEFTCRGNCYEGSLRQNFIGKERWLIEICLDLISSLNTPSMLWRFTNPLANGTAFACVCFRPRMCHVERP